jgi:hypothetical protein
MKRPREECGCGFQDVLKESYIETGIVRRWNNCMSRDAMYTSDEEVVRLSRSRVNEVLL